MKKLLFMAAFAAFGLSTTFAQGSFKVGVNFALPIGDAGDVSSFSLGLDAAYLIEISEKFEVGGATGFTNAFGKTESLSSFDLNYDYVQFIPVAVAARFNATDKFYVGADLGYAIGITDLYYDGFYYHPRVGYSFTDMIGANVSYTGISADGGDWSTIGLGVEFTF